MEFRCRRKTSKKLFYSIKTKTKHYLIIYICEKKITENFFYLLFFISIILPQCKNWKENPLIWKCYGFLIFERIFVFFISRYKSAKNKTVEIRVDKTKENGRILSQTFECVSVFRKKISQRILKAIVFSNFFARKKERRSRTGQKANLIRLTKRLHDLYVINVNKLS